MCGSNSSLSSSRIRYERDAVGRPRIPAAAQDELAREEQPAPIAIGRGGACGSLAPALALNVLHISESDGAGGAGGAAYRLHRGLRAHGHSSRMLVGRRVT